MEDNHETNWEPGAEAAEESNSRVAQTSSARGELPHLLSLPLSEGSGRILRYKSNRSPTSPCSQPLIRQSQNGATNINGPVSSDTDIRQSEHCKCDTVLMVGAARQSPEIEDCRIPIITASACSADDVSLNGEGLTGAMLEDFSRPEQNQVSSGHSANFTIGEESQSQSNLSMVCNDVTLQADLPPPPSYEIACRKKMTGDLNRLSVNTMDSLQPPTYRDAVGRARYIEDAPPNYHTLFAQSVFRMMDIRSEIVGRAENENRSMFGTIVTYFVLSASIFFIIGMVLPLPFAMIIIGVTHLQSCPAQPRIPVFLTSLGVFQLLECCGRLSMYIYSKLRVQNHRDEARYKSKDPFVYFIVVWFVVGSMWVYQNYPTCHDVIPQDIRTVRKGGFADNDWANNQTKHTTPWDRLLTAKVVRPTSLNTMLYMSTGLLGSNGRLRRRPNVSTARETVNNRATIPLRTTAKVPEKIQKAACCGKTVYFFTFSIVTLYYSLVGILFFVHICGSFVRLLCRCRRQSSDI